MSSAAFPLTHVTVRRIPPVIASPSAGSRRESFNPGPAQPRTAADARHIAEAARILPRLEKLVYFLDMAWHIPGTPIRFGADSLIGFIPIAGDLVMLATSLTIVFYALKWRLPWHVILRMLLNCIIDLTIGIVPIIGDIGDTLFKANVYNYRLLKMNRPK